MIKQSIFPENDTYRKLFIEMMMLCSKSRRLNNCNECHHSAACCELYTELSFACDNRLVKLRDYTGLVSEFNEIIIEDFQNNHSNKKHLSNYRSILVGILNNS